MEFYWLVQLRLVRRTVFGRESGVNKFEIRTKLIFFKA
jgi:hypothetical protein